MVHSVLSDTNKQEILKYKQEVLKTLRGQEKQARCRAAVLARATELRQEKESTKRLL